MTSLKNKVFLGVPLGVLRRFVQMNETHPDSYIQLFEIDPRFIFTESQLEHDGAEIRENGSVVVDLGKLYGGENAN